MATDALKKTALRYTARTAVAAWLLTSIRRRGVALRVDEKGRLRVSGFAKLAEREQTLVRSFVVELRALLHAENTGDEIDSLEHLLSLSEPTERRSGTSRLIGRPLDDDAASELTVVRSDDELGKD